MTGPHKEGRRLLESVTNNGVVIGFIVIVIVLSMVAPYFMTTRNLSNVLLQSSPYIILALGQLVVVLVAGIDLSVGAMVGLSGVIAGYMMIHMDIPWVLSIIVTLILITILGLMQGALISYMRITDFVATLAGLSIFRGLTLGITHGYPINSLPAHFNFIGQGHVFGIPFPVILAAVALLFVLWWLTKTASGIHLYAIGGNTIAAYRSGIKVRLLRTFAYGVSALMAGIAGMIVAARLSTATPTAGTGYELTAIAAVVIGGISLFGGRGTAWGAVLGALIIATILNGLVLMNVSPFYVQMAEGFIILAAVLLDNLRLRRDNEVR